MYFIKTNIKEVAKNLKKYMLFIHLMKIDYEQTAK